MYKIRIQPEGKRMNIVIPIEIYVDPYIERAVAEVEPSVVSVVFHQGRKDEYQRSGIIFEACDNGNPNAYYVLTSATSLTPPPTDDETNTTSPPFAAQLWPSLFLDDEMSGRCSPTAGRLDPSFVGEEKSNDSDSPDSVLPRKRVSAEQNEASSSQTTYEICVYLSSGEMCMGEIFARDDYYNIAVLKIESTNQLRTACLRPVDDSVATVFCRPVDGRDSLKLVPGDAVIAVGRHYGNLREIIATSGEYCTEHFKLQHACKDFLLADCKMNKFRTGGPLISYTGEVIGIIFYDPEITPFLPMNIFLKWWEYFKVNQIYRRPWVGVEACNLFAAPARVWESIRELNIFHAVVIKKVLPGSPAEDAGIQPLDIIVKCAGTSVMSFLEFLEILWDKVGNEVDIEVIRNGSPSEMKIGVGDITVSTCGVYQNNALGVHLADIFA